MPVTYTFQNERSGLKYDGDITTNTSSRVV